MYPNYLMLETQSILMYCILIISSITEDRKRIQICLVKDLKSASHCWKSLLKDQFEASPVTYDEMQKKLTLQRYQFEVSLLYSLVCIA